MLRPDTFALTLLLALLTALGPLSTDMYVPSLPAIGQALHAPTAQVQLTISSYLLGFATGGSDVGGIFAGDGGYAACALSRFSGKTVSVFIPCRRCPTSPSHSGPT